MRRQDGPVRVLLVGDIMLDVNRAGSVERVSPEGPVVIVKNPTTRLVLGGAANTAANVATLGGQVTLAGVVGSDEAGASCRGLLTQAGIGDGLIAADGYHTTVKTRFLARGQHIMRLDEEDPSVPDPALDALIAQVNAHASSYDAVIISDYDKGVVTPRVAQAVIRAATAAHIPVVVDTKKLDMSCFVGASVITPNEMEATRATGIPSPEGAAHAIADITRADVIITLGPHGMLVHTSGTQTRIPAHSHEVADVVGAGDTVTAAITVHLAENTSDLIQAAAWANKAAAIAVQHAGTYPVQRIEIP